MADESFPDPAHRRPDGVDDETVAAVGKLAEAMEWLERARGRLYDFHQMMGHLDFVIEEAADQLERAGHREHADLLRTEVMGRNVLDGRWTYQVVEEFDAAYYDPVREIDRRVHDELMQGRRHVHEAELKAQRRSVGRRGHEALPARARPSFGGDAPEPHAGP